MSEVRLNHITGDWVIISTERAKRPEDFAVKKEGKEIPVHVATCPFCPGNEDKTPDETFRFTGPDGNWLVRSVPNKFSALTPEGDIRKEKVDFKQVVSGVGRHEVIIETPEHNKTTALLTDRPYRTDFNGIQAPSGCFLRRSTCGACYHL